MRAKNILHPHARVSVRAPATQFSIPLTLEDDEKTGFGGDQPFVSSLNGPVISLVHPPC